MNKVIWKSIGEYPYFLGNVLVEIRVLLLPDCHLVLSLHKHRSVEVFLNQKNEESKQGSPLNSSIDYLLALTAYKDSKLESKNTIIREEKKNLFW